MIVVVEVEGSGWTPNDILKEELIGFSGGWDIRCGRKRIQEWFSSSRLGLLEGWSCHLMGLERLQEEQVGDGRFCCVKFEISTWYSKSFRKAFGYASPVSGERSESHQSIDHLQDHGTDEIIHWMSGEKRSGIRAVLISFFSTYFY